MSKLIKFQNVAIQNAAAVKGGYAAPTPPNNCNTNNYCAPKPTTCAPQPNNCYTPQSNYCAPKTNSCFTLPSICLPKITFSFSWGC